MKITNKDYDILSKFANNEIKEWSKFLKDLKKHYEESKTKKSK